MAEEIWAEFHRVIVELTRAVLKLGGFFIVETITDRLSMFENTQKQNFRSLVRLGYILQAFQKLKIGPKWYFIWDYGKIGIQMAKVLVSKTYWR
jgi:hypothetical protein